MVGGIQVRMRLACICQDHVRERDCGEMKGLVVFVVADLVSVL